MFDIALADPGGGGASGARPLTAADLVYKYLLGHVGEILILYMYQDSFWGVGHFGDMFLKV